MLDLRSRWPVYLFVLWSEARTQESRILADLAATFTVLEILEVTWAPDETFSRNLSRMYGDALPPGSDKEVHCGTGPCLAVVVQDRRPRFGLRRTGRGRKVLNSSVFDARLRYRRWTGGGYRVHASDSTAETERNLVLLFGAGTADFYGRRPSMDGARVHAADPVGTHGWASLDQLLLALEPYGARPASRPGAGDRLNLVASDVWWAERIAGGRELGVGVREIEVAGRPLELTIREQPARPVRAVDALIRWVRR